MRMPGWLQEDLEQRITVVIIAAQIADRMKAGLMTPAATQLRAEALIHRQVRRALLPVVLEAVAAAAQAEVVVVQVAGGSKFNTNLKF